MFLGAEENRRIGGGEVEQMGEALFLDQRAIADLDQMVAAARVLSSLGGEIGKELDGSERVT